MVLDRRQGYQSSKLRSDLNGKRELMKNCQGNLSAEWEARMTEKDDADKFIKEFRKHLSEVDEVSILLAELVRDDTPSLKTSRRRRTFSMSSSGSSP